MDKFNITQRRWLADNFKDCLVNHQPNGESYFRYLGPTVQAAMREAVNYICLHKPMKGEIVKKKQNGDEVEFVKIQIEVFQPGTNDKIVLERSFTKALLETK